MAKYAPTSDRVLVWNQALELYQFGVEAGSPPIAAGVMDCDYRVIEVESLSQANPLEQEPAIAEDGGR